MATQAERQNYLWRPNDNSATTRVRYDLESEHWLRSLSTKLEKGGRGATSFASDLRGIGIVLHLISLVIFIILLSISKLLVWLVSLTESRPSTRVVERRPAPLSNDELKSRINNGELKVVNVYED